MSRYTEKEKQIYTPPLPDGAARDPLAVRRTLYAATGGRLNDLLADADAAAAVTAETTGDITRGPENFVVAAQAEESLARAARKAFGLPGFPDGPPDGVVLEAMHHFLDWLEGNA